MDSRRDTFAEMDRMFEQIRRAMLAIEPENDRWTSEGDGRTEIARRGRRSGTDVNLTVETLDDGYVVLADLPGFEKDEIDLRIEGDSLVVTAHHETDEDRDGVRTRRHRHVSERMTIPGGVLEDDVTATYRNGVLEIHLPAETETGGDGHRIDID